MLLELIFIVLLNNEPDEQAKDMHYYKKVHDGTATEQDAGLAPGLSLVWISLLGSS